MGLTYEQRQEVRRQVDAARRAELSDRDGRVCSGRGLNSLNEFCHSWAGGDGLLALAKAVDLIRDGTLRIHWTGRQTMLRPNPDGRPRT